jgi:shikimate dehydrogenase
MKRLIANSFLYDGYVKIHSLFGSEYERKTIKADALKDFILSDEADSFNVAPPFENEIGRYLENLDESALKTGAVDTVVIRDGMKTGYNTEIRGMKFMLEKSGVTLADKAVTILGGGTAAREAEYLCKKLGARKIYAVKRIAEINYGETADTDVIINATPVGKIIGERPVDLSKFPNASAVADTVSAPFNTALLQQAAKLNMKTAHGLCMLVSGAKYSEDLFDGKEFSDGGIAEVYAGMRKIMQNVVLIGMPSSGKTTLGKTLAAVLGKRFIDTDKEIEKRQNASVAKIFAEYGEKYFRMTEKKEAERLADEKACVISCGGGMPLDAENMVNLRYNGVIVNIKRDVGLLSTEGRPLSSGREALIKMEAERSPIYEKYADFSVSNNTLPQDAEEKILRGLDEIFSR